MLYEITLTRETETAKGLLKQICERYIYEAMLVSECEAKCLEEYPECEVIGVNRSKIMEIVNENERDGAYYKGKITETSVNDNGDESSRSYQILCNAKDLQGATKIFLEYLKGTLEDATLDSVTKTKIVDIL